MVRGEFCAGAFVGRFELPNPCGARPRSVELPCASQVRPLPARLLLPAGPLVERLPGIAEGGRFCESSRWRGVIRELEEFAGALPGRFWNWPLVLMLLCTPELPTWAFALAEPFTCAPPKRPAVVAPFIVRTDSREAARAGAVRAMTERFWIAFDGRATWPLKLEAPRVLCCVGRMPTEFVALAPFNPACVRCCPPRLMRPPLVKLLREVVVTARRLCAFTKLKFRLLNTFTLRMNVLWTLITLTKPRLQWNHGKNGSPQPSGNQPTPRPTPKPQPPPSQPTKAGP